MSAGDYTRGAPFVEYRPREIVHPRRLRVYILLPNGERHAPIVDDHPDIEDHITDIARALAERDRRVKGRRVGGGELPPATR